MRNREQFKKITLLVCAPNLRERVLKIFKENDKI